MIWHLYVQSTQGSFIWEALLRDKQNIRLQSWGLILASSTDAASSHNHYMCVERLFPEEFVIYLLHFVPQSLSYLTRVPPFIHCTEPFIPKRFTRRKCAEWYALMPGAKTEEAFFIIMYHETKP